MSSKNEILNNISNAVKDIKHTKHDVAEASVHIINDGDLVQNCINNLTTNKTNIITCEESEIAENVQKIVDEINVKNLLYYNNLPFDVTSIKAQKLISYDKSSNEMHDTLFECDTSIVKAKLAVSNLGVFCITSDEQPRLMSLLPQNCIVLLKKEDIVNSMNDANKIFTKGPLPTNIVYISGPSRTADIELQIVLGVHGPQNVYGIIY